MHVYREQKKAKTKGAEAYLEIWDSKAKKNSIHRGREGVYRRGVSSD